ncbi:ELL-associated factor 1-like, partial [Paramuricea clavata]
MNVDDFKPASVDTSQAGSLDVGKGGEVNVSLPNTQDSGTTVYRGSKKPCPKECVLVVDRGKRTITLERLASTVQLKKIRSASGSKVSSSQGSQQSETSHSQEDPKASAKPVESNVNAESGGSSNSSSSESDSDLEDEEVARLNASLIEQTTEQNKALDARPESSSSFNL